MKTALGLIGAVLLFLALGALAQGYLSHSPIVIASDSDFTRENGVVGGSGAQDDPYIIAGWEIDAGRGTGILIKGVTASFVIRDCRIEGKPLGTGISLVGTRGARVEGCELVGLGTGVFVYQADRVTISGSRFAGCRVGIEGTESPRLAISSSNFSQPVKRGIFLWRCHDGSLMENRISGGETAVYLDSCHRDLLAGNAIEGAGQGLFLWDSFDCRISGNLLYGCDLGVALVHTSAGNTVSRNAFLGCERPAACDGPGNLWDGGYPTGGNYWEELELADRFSGPEQDQPGPDGIGDAPVVVPLGCRDRYPLMAPPPEVPRPGGGEEEG